MDNLIFCLNVTVPIFLTLLLGYFFRRIGLFDETFVNRMNKFVFVIPLPVLLFQDIAKIDIYEAWDPKMVLFCFAITSLSIIISVLLSRFLHPSDIRPNCYPGILPQQRSDPWYRHYPEPLRKCRYDTTDDHCQRPSLQCNGCCSSLCL